MGMTIDTIINDCEQSIKQSELFIKAHQKNMEIGEIKEYQYYIERDKMIINTMNKYQQIEQILDDCDLEAWEVLEKVKEVVEDGKID